jgi:hypothetical protein
MLSHINTAHLRQERDWQALHLATASTAPAAYLANERATLAAIDAELARRAS